MSRSPAWRKGTERARRALGGTTLPGVGSAERVERLWWTRLRWRMRGAWLWPTVLLLVAVEIVLLLRLPPYGTSGPGNAGSAFLLAGFANLFLIAAIAPLLGRRLRRRRPDLPQVVAADYAGTSLVCLLAAGILVAGVAHRPAIAGVEEDRRAMFAAVHSYVSSSEPGYQNRLVRADAVRLEDEMYRTCVPGTDPKRWLCLFVRTEGRPASVTLDKDRVGNSAYRQWGAFD